MIVGFCTGSWYLYMVQWGGMTPWIGIDHLRFGIIGTAASLIAMVAVTLMTKEPDAEIQKMVDDMRVPVGNTVISESH